MATVLACQNAKLTAQLERTKGVTAMHATRPMPRLMRPATPLQRCYLSNKPRTPSLRSSVQVVAEASSIAGKVCLVTGASQGIGKAIALELGKAGSKVAINYRDDNNKADAEAVVKEIEALGGQGFIVKADMTKYDELEAMYKAVVDEFGQLDVLVNNAGITKDTLMAMMKPAQWQAVIDVNLSAVFYNCQLALKAMAKKKVQGRIVNIASVVGVIGNAGQANYSAAKAGVIGMSKTIAREYAGRGITCNAVAPGFIATAMTAVIPENIQEGILKGIPLGRMGTPDEVAGLVRFLALDPAAAYITGQCVQINGGMSM